MKLIRKHELRWCALALVSTLLTACGPQCPATNAIRDDLPATASAGSTTLTLRATRIAQPNDAPAVLLLRWSPTQEAVQLTLSDADGNVLAHPSATSAPQVDGFALLRLQDAHGAALMPGLYGITLASGSAAPSSPPVTARFEIVHCALYY